VRQIPLRLSVSVNNLTKHINYIKFIIIFSKAFNELVFYASSPLTSIRVDGYTYFVFLFRHLFCAAAIRSRPCAVFGPVLSPPCRRHLRFPMTGRIKQAPPARVLAPHKPVSCGRVSLSAASIGAVRPFPSQGSVITLPLDRPHDGRRRAGA
jgi:hypothetical protein